MPCCCATNVQAAIVLGIIGIILSLISCGETPISGRGIALGILGAIRYAILVYGAYVRKHKEILFWMIFSTMLCILNFIHFIILCVKNKGIYWYCESKPENGIFRVFLTCYADYTSKDL